MRSFFVFLLISLLAYYSYAAKNDSNKRCYDYLTTNIPVTMIKKCVYNDIVSFYDVAEIKDGLSSDAYISIDGNDSGVYIIPCGHIIQVQPKSYVFISPLFPFDTGLANLYADSDNRSIKAEVQRVSGGTYIIDHISRLIPDELCAYKLVGIHGNIKISKERKRLKIDENEKERISRPTSYEEDAIKNNYCPGKKLLFEKILFSSTTAIILTKDDRILQINGYRVIGKCEDESLKAVDIGDLLISTDGEKISYDSIFAVKFCEKLNYLKWVFIKPDGTVYKVDMKK